MGALTQHRLGQVKGEGGIMDHNRDLALPCAGAGFSVFPCAADATKRPLIRWRSRSTTNPDIIAALWTKWPGSLVGIDLHKCELLVIDADRHDGCADGVAAFAALTRKYRADLSAVPMTLTPGNGIHFYFRQPAEPLGNREGYLPDGINVRGSGGLVIAPSCITENGKHYGSLAGHPNLIAAFAAGSIPVVPSWLVDIIHVRAIDRASHVATLPRDNIAPAGSGNKRERAWALAALNGCIADLAGCPPGRRNHTLNAVAYRLGRIAARGWLERGDVERYLQSAAEQCGLIVDDGARPTQATLASGLNAGIKAPAPELGARR
jgi:hypothetical protein